MSRAYRNSSDVPLDAIIKRLHELSDAVVGGRKTQAQEFVMRVPAECDHDADLVLAEAAVRLDALRKYNAELQAENDNLRKANQDCVAWEKACKADLDRALARVAELEEGLAGIENCAFGYQGCRQTAEEAADWMNAEATRLLEGTNGAHTLRKQAEAVEAAVKEAMPGPCGPPDDPPAGYQEFCEGVVSVRDYATRLRQQADRMEADMGEDHG